MFRRLTSLVIVLALAPPASATPQDETPLARVGDRRFDQPVETPPEAPAEFRTLRPETLPGALALFDRLHEAPADAANRRALADLYRQAGYSWVASFVEATVDPLEGRVVDYPNADSSIAWGMGTAGETQWPQEQETIERICALVRDNEYQEAVDFSTASLSDGPYSLREVAAWSYAALWYVVAQAGPVGEGAPEVSFRVFLTNLEDAYPPNCLATRSAGFQLLSGFFSRLGDPVSAYTAAAIEHALYFASPPASRTDAYTELLEQRVESLAGQLEALTRAES